jgi:uncharacterized protein
MPAVDYAPNTPRWVDLGSPDLEGSKRFYTQLFGWEADSMPVETAGGYTIMKQGGKQVAGAGPLMMEGQPTVWTTYVYVDDLDATAAKVSAAGGTVMVQPMDVMDVGRMAIFMDPQGAVVAGWQPQAHTGAELFNEPVSICWNELATRDVEGSKRFYNQVFGWTGETHPYGPTSYTELKAGDATAAGMREMGEQDPANVPPHWLVYFAVADTDATVAKAQELGARLLVPAMTIPAGRLAVLSDPQGAVFAVIAMGGEASS